MKTSNGTKPVITMIRKIVAAGLIAMMLGGCSYNATLQPNLNMSAITTVMHPYTLVIDASSLSNSQASANVSGYHLRINTGDALAKSIKHLLSKSFSSVEISNSSNHKLNYDYLVTIGSDTNAICYDNSCSFSSNTSMQMINKNDSNKEILTGDFVDTYFLSMPSWTVPIMFITELSLFTLGPILLPIIRDNYGDDLMQQVSKSNDKISLKIANRILFANVYDKK